MKKSIVAALALSLAATAGFAGGPGPTIVEDDVDNDNNPFIVAPSGGMGTGAAIGVAVGAALLVAAVAGGSDSDDSTDTTEDVGE